MRLAHQPHAEMGVQRPVQCILECALFLIQAMQKLWFGDSTAVEPTDLMCLVQVGHISSIQRWGSEVACLLVMASSTSAVFCSLLSRLLGRPLWSKCLLRILRRFWHTVVCCDVSMECFMPDMIACPSRMSCLRFPDVPKFSHWTLFS